MSNTLIALLGLMVGAIAEAFILYYILNLLQETGAVRQNYQGIDIPVGTGISFSVSVMIAFLVYGLLSRYDVSFHIYLLGLVAISFLGFIDDILGQRDTMGFKGHFGALFKGRLTTGGLKALGGGLIAFFLAFFLSGHETWWYEWANIILNTLIMALFTNTLNLFDLRPGRAVKAYFVFLAAIIALAAGNINWLLLTPLLGAVIYYAAGDLKAKTMMGDAGSNVLGLALGYLSVVSLSLPVRVGMLVFLIGIHIYTEKYSLTKTIEKVPFLKAIDELGRENN